jgi:4-amino-4-deoxy-L-arabinose transferase-like glycosyltransferase
MSTLRLPLLILILVLYLGSGLLYAQVTPAWQAPDEPAHYNYISHLVTYRILPILWADCYDEAYLRELTSRRFPPELPVDTLCYEFHQPPLYYLLSTPLFVASGGSLLALRLFSVGLGAGVVLFAFLIGQTIFPDRPLIALGAAVFVASVPMHVAILASVNNDALAELIFAAILFLLIRRLMRPAAVGKSPLPADVGLGVLLGLALLTKMTIYMALPLVALTLWFTATRAGQPRLWGRFIKQATVIFGIALLISLPWFWRNGATYGPLDIFGLIRHNIIVEGQLRTRFYVADLGLLGYLGNLMTITFRSFWGQFGWMAVPMDQRTYQLLAVLSLVSLGGLIGFWISRSVPSADFGFGWPARGRINGERRAEQISAENKVEPATVTAAPGLALEQRQALLVLAVVVGLVAAAYGWYNLTFVQFQGRYLFPALVPLGIFFTLGLVEAFAPRWRWWLVGWLAVALIWVAVASLLGDGFDARGGLIVGLLLVIFSARAWFAPTSPRAWPVALCFAALALLTLLSPFWFVIPNL